MSMAPSLTLFLQDLFVVERIESGEERATQEDETKKCLAEEQEDSADLFFR